MQTEREIGHDTPTGTDPNAKYEGPGYEDKSGGQAFKQDEELAERLMQETGGDVEEAERRFEEEAVGAPALARQQAAAERGERPGQDRTGTLPPSD